MSTVTMPRRPSEEELIRAAALLVRLGVKHGLTRLRLGGPGELVVDVAPDRTYFDIVAFERDVEGRLGYRPEVVPSTAAGAHPGRLLSSNGSDAA